MSNRNPRGILAMEEAREEVAERDEQAVILEATDAIVDSPQETEAEAVEAVDTVEQDHADSEQQADVAESLDNIAAKVEETLPEGGMGEKPLEAVKVATEAMFRSLGLDTSRSAYQISTEGMTSAIGKVEKTRIAAEQISEIAKKAWAGLVAFFQRLFQSVKAAFMHLVDANTRHENKAKGMLNALSKIKTGVFDKDAKVKVPGTLSVGGKLVGAADLVSAFKKHAGDKIFSADSLKNAEAGLKEIASATEKSDAGAITEAWKKIQESFLPEVNHELVFGGAKVVAKFSSENGAASSKLESGDKVESGEVQAANPEQIGELCKVIAEVTVGQNRSIKSAVSELEKAGEHLVAVSKKAMSGKEDASKEVKYIHQSINAVFTMTAKVSLLAAKYSTMINGDVLSYAAHSLRATKAVKEAAPEAQKQLAAA